MTIRVAWLAALIASLGIMTASAQHRLRGIVVDPYGRAIRLASVYPIDSFEGASTDSLGRFAFETRASLPLRLVASHLSYQSDTLIVMQESVQSLLSFTLKPKDTKTLAEVVVSVGMLRLGDRKGLSAMRPMDIYTNPAGSGDLALSMRQLPGLQDVGQSEGFFVRGGDASETTVTIEGIRIPHFFGRNGNNTPTRSRFPTGMFRGLSLATGGYGASKQGGLSGLLELSLAAESPSSLSISLTPIFAGIGWGHLSPSKKLYLEQQFSLAKTSALKLLMKPEYQFVQSPQGLDYSARLSWRPTSTDEVKALGMLKRESLIALAPAPTGEGILPERYEGRNAYAMALARWRHFFDDGKTSGSLALGTIWDRNHRLISYPDLPQTGIGLHTKELETQLRLGLASRYRSLRWATGIDYTHSSARLRLNSVGEVPDLREATTATYLEGLLPLTQNLSLEAGLRLEHSSRLRALTLLPRLSLAYRLGRGAMLSLDLGRYTRPANYYLSQGISPRHREEAYQANLTYEYKPSSKHLVRIQLYDKEYRSLTLLRANRLTSAAGKGYARGLDLLWRMGNLLPNFEYWLSYTYTDTRRSHLYAHELERPSFVARHSASAMLKYWCAPIQSQLNLALSYRTGMPYHDPNVRERGYYNQESQEVWDLSLSYNYPFLFGRVSGVFVASVQGLLNPSRIYTYRFAPQPDATGYYNATPITTPYRQFVMLGLFLNIGVDRRQEIINNHSL